MAKKLLVTLNGAEVVDTNAEEDAVLAQVREQYDSVEKPNIDAQKTIAESGNQKLLDLGLTQAEVTAMTGYKPE